MSQYLGDISAYALAVSQGYTGTEEEYAELMASYATVGQTAVNAAQTATTKASEAATSATTATNKASEATTAATTATTKAGEASTSASTATSAKDTAVSASQTATTKATEATTAAATAVSAKDDAVSANTAAQSAKTAAQTAQTGAETAAASVSASAAQIATNTDDIAQLKGELTDYVLPSVFERYENIVIPNNQGLIRQNLYIKASDGTEETAGSNTYYVLGPINVLQGDVYYISCKMRFNNAVVAFYRSDNSFISCVSGNKGTQSGSNYIFDNYEVTVPENATYMKIGIYEYTYTLKKLLGSFVSSNPNWINKKWVCIGDSLTANNSATTKHYFDYVSDDTGITTVNMGANGTGYAKASGSGTAFYDRIASVPVDADVVTIFGSFNDLTSGLIFGEVDDTGTDTVAGCINTTISNLQARIPLVNLGIVAPTPWDTTQPNFNADSNSFKYWNMLKSICERRSIPFLDLWHCSNLRPWDADFRTLAYSNDGGSGTHPDENGHKLIAPRFKGFLETLLM